MHHFWKVLKENPPVHAHLYSQYSSLVFQCKLGYSSKPSIVSPVDWSPSVWVPLTLQMYTDTNTYVLINKGKETNKTGHLGRDQNVLRILQHIWISQQTGKEEKCYLQLSDWKSGTNCSSSGTWATKEKNCIVLGCLDYQSTKALDNSINRDIYLQLTKPPAAG